MKRKLFIFLLGLVYFFSGTLIYAQDRIAIKSNLIYDVAASINVGAEVGFAPRWTADVSGNLNLWTFKDNTKWKHWMVQPEVRFWTCSRFAGHFFAFHALAGQFNFGHIKNDVRLLGTDFSILTDERYQGWAFGAGLGYGYALPIGRHWNLEGELGLGAIYSRADGFECDVCNRPTQSDVRKLRPALTKVAFSIVYLF